MANVMRHDATFAVACDVLVIGAGAAGSIAALRAHEAGAHVVVLERDGLARGSTALSAGLVPAAGTRFQATIGIADSPPQFAADIMAKCHGEADPDTVATVAEAVGPALEWLADRHGLAFSVIDNFTYPGHAARRMHALPSRSGSELMDRLRLAIETAGIDVVFNARAETLLIGPHGRIVGVAFIRPDGAREMIGCRAVVLACNGYGGNASRVAKHIPTMARALYFGHPGNQGDALAWGETLGAATRHLSGYQGHGSVAHPHGILITWATMTEGGYQVTLDGARFANETQGYSEQAEVVLRQRDGLVWSIFDDRIAGIARQFEDFRTALSAGAIVTADTVDELARRCHLPVDDFSRTATEVDHLKIAGAIDRFGRAWASQPVLVAPFCAVKVTGAVFHTQGGLVVDRQARVVDDKGDPIVGMYAAGGAACGVSGAQASGYLSGNGLLTAVAYGFIAGAQAGENC